MNDRIKELAEQADPEYTGEYNDDMGHALVGNEAIQRFAELILLEVTDILSTYRGKIIFQDGFEYNCQHPIVAIKEHFGVK